MILRYNGNLNINAKKLRHNMTKEERRLWYNFLCSYPIRFLRQKIIGDYIVDLYCSAAGLIVEVDGSQHYEDDNILKDAERTAFLNGLNLTVVRVSNREVNSNFRGVCEYIDHVASCAISDRGK